MSFNGSLSLKDGVVLPNSSKKEKHQATITGSEGE